MAIQNRTVTITGVFAADASTTIPPTPVSGASYRDESMTGTVVREGWAFKTIVDSSKFNQAMYEYSSLTSQIEKYGFLPWSSLTDYEQNSLCLGTDGVIYQAKQATGPSTTVQDPTTDSSDTYWQDFVGETYATKVYIQSIFNALYPVGSLYITTNNADSCPVAQFISGSTWELVAADKALWTSDRNGNTTIEAGLPNITGQMNSPYGLLSSASGAFTTSGSHGDWDGGGSVKRYQYVNFNASRSSAIYGNSSTVQPPAYRVNVWRRTA